MTEPLTLTHRKRTVALQPRDLILLADVFDNRFITIHHAHLIHFPAVSRRAVETRLQELAAVGLLNAQSTDLQNPKTAYRLTKRTIETLDAAGALRLPQGEERDEWMKRQRGRYTGKIAPSRLQHELGTLDIKAALQPALEGVPHLRVVEFGVWPEHYEFPAHPGSETKTKKPDGFLHIAEHWPNRPAPNAVFCYIEMDRGGEKRDVVLDKLDAYQHHLASGNFARWLGVDPQANPRPKFRVLVVVQSGDSRKRCLTLAERIADTRPDDTVTRLASLEDLQRDPLGDIWLSVPHFRGWRERGARGQPERVPLFKNLSTDPERTG